MSMDPKAFYESYLENSYEGNMFGLTKLAGEVAKTGLKGYVVLDMGQGQINDNPKHCLFGYTFFIYKDSILPDEWHQSKYLYRIANCAQDLLGIKDARHRCSVSLEHAVQTQHMDGTYGVQLNIHESFWNMPVLGKAEIHGAEMIASIGEWVPNPEEAACHKAWCLRFVQTSSGSTLWRHIIPLRS